MSTTTQASNPNVSMDQLKAIIVDLMDTTYASKEYSSKPSGPKLAGSKPASLKSKSDTSSDSAKSLPDMDLRVDLYLQDKDEDFKFGGHTLMGIETEWGLPELCDAISHKFKGDQKLPAMNRPNLAPETVWSDHHKVKKIASVPKDAVTTAWDTEAIEKHWLFSEDNCTHLLRAMEQHRAPESLAVYISRNKYDDYIY